MALRVFMVDDNRTFLAAAQDALATVDGVTVVGHAVCGRDALAQIALLKPDMVLLDIGLPDISGIEVGMQMRTWAQPPRIIFLSLHDGAHFTALIQQVGSMGYVNKANFVTELLPLLESLVPCTFGSTHK
jgi:DNA-binding NarL/FixJ family response regulator